MGVIKFDRDFETLFAWDTDENPTTEQDYQNAVKNWTETEMNIVDTLLWQPTTEYATGNIVKTPSLPSQYVLRCAEAGTSGSTEPSYSGASVGDTVTDGTVEWVIVSLATGNAADVDAGNIGVNAEVDNSEAWAIAIGGGAIAEDDGRLVKGSTVYAVTSELASDIATNTEAIEDNTEAIATNTETIAQHTTDIDIAEKRIGNIEKLLQGNLYDYQTDTNSAYTKTVLAGAMPYASLDSIGGKTVVWNQQWVNTMARQATFNGITETKTDNGLTATGTPTVTSNQWLWNFTCVSGHKYFIGGCPVHEGVRLNCYYSSDGYLQQSNGFIIAPTTSNGIVYVAIQTPTSGTEINIAWTPMLIDLTLLYGSGNESTTVEEFTAQFPASYYPYNAGTLLSAGVTEVVSVGKNLAYYGEGLGTPSNTATSNATKRIFEVGKYVLGLTYNNYYVPTNITQYSAVDNTITVTNSASGYGLAIPFNCLGGNNYTINLTQTNGLVRVGWYAEDGTYISGNVVSAYPTTLTAPSGARQGTVILYDATDGVQATFNNVIVAEGTTATYVPAKAPISTPIPAEIQALEGYGWSAGTAYNYVDYERKVFVQNVGRLHYDSTGWVLRNTQENGIKTYSRQETSVTNFAAGYISNIVKGKVTNYVVGYIGGVTWMYELGACMAVLSGGNYVYINTTDISNTDLNIYYVLATPIETDISAYITDDNLISVESGGTLTFPNSNGDDYRINVSSAETYMVDLQSALGE